MKKEKLLGCLDMWFVNTDWSENGVCPPIPDKHKRAYREIVALIENQPTIAEKDIQGWAYEAIDRITSDTWGCASTYIEDTIKEMLTELGVSITVDRGK